MSVIRILKCVSLLIDLEYKYNMNIVLLQIYFVKILLTEMLHLPVIPGAKTGGCWSACNTNCANQIFGLYGGSRDLQYVTKKNPPLSEWTLILYNFNLYL